MGSNASRFLELAKNCQAICRHPGSHNWPRVQGRDEKSWDGAALERVGVSEDSGVSLWLGRKDGKIERCGLECWGVDASVGERTPQKNIHSIGVGLEGERMHSIRKVSRSSPGNIPHNLPFI